MKKRIVGNQEDAQSQYEFRPFERRDVADAFKIIRSKRVFRYHTDHAAFLTNLATYFDSRGKSKESAPEYNKTLNELIKDVDAPKRVIDAIKKPASYEYHIMEERAKDRKRGRVVGITGLYGDGYKTPNVLWIGWTAVRPDRQRQGIGTQMINMLGESMKERGVDTLCVETDSSLIGAQRFYRKNGFKESGRIKQYFEGEQDLIIYSKNL